MSLPETDAPFRNRLLVIVLAVAAFLRLYHLTGFSLSNDELSALARLRFDNLHALIQQGVIPDFHPAGVQVFLWFWTGLFGISEWMVRLPFALLGIGSVYLLFLIGKRWYGITSGLLAACGLATLQFPLLYSQIARPYSPGLFFSLLAVWFWTLALFDDSEPDRKIGKKQLARFAGFALSVSACMYIHYFSFILAGLICLSGLFFLKRNTWIPYLASGALIVLLYIPHFDVFMHHLSKGGIGGAEGWLGPPGKDAFGKYLNYCFNNSPNLKLIYLIIGTGSWLIYRRQLSYSRFHFLALSFFIVPFAVAYYYSIWKNPVFQHSVLLFSFPFLLLLLFSFIPRDTYGKTTFFLFSILLCGTVFSTVREEKYYSTAHFSEFREIARRMSSITQSLGSDQITRTMNVFDPYYLGYYLSENGDTIQPAQSDLMGENGFRNFNHLLSVSTKKYFLFAWSNTFDDPATDLLIRIYYPWIVVRDSFLNSGLRLYSNTKTDTAWNRLPQISDVNGFEHNQWNNETELQDILVFRTGTASIHMKPENEYSPGMQFNLGDKGLTAGTRIDVTTWFRSEKIGSEAKLIFSLERKGQNIIWNGTPAGKFVYAPNIWCPVVLSVTIPNGSLPDDEVKIYLWNEKREDFYFDDIRIDYYLPRR